MGSKAWALACVLVAACDGATASTPDAAAPPEAASSATAGSGAAVAVPRRPGWYGLDDDSFAAGFAALPVARATGATVDRPLLVVELLPNAPGPVRVRVGDAAPYGLDARKAGSWLWRDVGDASMELSEGNGYELAPPAIVVFAPVEIDAGTVLRVVALAAIRVGTDVPLLLAMRDATPAVVLREIVIDPRGEPLVDAGPWGEQAAAVEAAAARHRGPLPVAIDDAVLAAREELRTEGGVVYDDDVVVVVDARVASPPPGWPAQTSVHAPVSARRNPLLRRVVRMLQSTVRRCVSPLLAREPGLRGRVELHVVLADGALAALTVANSTITDARFGSCLASRPWPRGSAAGGVAYPVVVTVAPGPAP